MNTGGLRPVAATVKAVAGNESQQRTELLQIRALVQVRAATCAALGELQVRLMRELTARLNASDAHANDSLPVDASTDQLEAAVREAKATLDTAPRHHPTAASPDG